MKHALPVLSLASASLLAALAAFSHEARADPAKPVVLVELFTSQGCSSCPPADAMVTELAGRDDVLALALHVDYWDYIGWADSFARSQHTHRQKDYARMAGSGSIYTPQMIVDGAEHIVGFQPMKLADLIAAHRGDTIPAEISVELDGDTLRLSCLANAEMASRRAVNVDLIRFTEAATVKILHGENAGKTISYSNIVTGWERLGSWKGGEDFAFSAELPGDGPLALLVQTEGPGPVLAAYRLR